MCLFSTRLRHVLALMPIIQIDANHLCCYISDKMRKCKCASIKFMDDKTCICMYIGTWIVLYNIQ